VAQHERLAAGSTPVLGFLDNPIRLWYTRLAGVGMGYPGRESSKTRRGVDSDMVRSVGKMVAGVLLLILGLLCTGILVYGLVTDLSIWVLGRRTMAEVVDLWVERTSESDAQELTFEYFASYRFTTPGGKTITSSSRLDVREWGSLEKGGDVSVVYFPPIPRHNRVDEARFVPMLACAYLPLVVVAWASLGVGWYMLRPTRVHTWWFSRREDA
jgi:hypothetical protein